MDGRRERSTCGMIAGVHRVGRRSDLPLNLLETVPPHRVARLRRQGERYFTDGLCDISGERRLAILAVRAAEWRGAIADTVVETHDRIVGQSFPSAKRLCDARIQDSRTVLRDTLDVLLGAPFRPQSAP